MEQFDAVSDRTELAVEENAGLLALDELEPNSIVRRSRRSGTSRRRVRTALVAAGKYRGELLHMRLHIRRALMHEAPTNKAGLKQVYELWGWTEESKSFPYVVLCSELPPGITLGAEVTKRRSSAATS